VSPGSTRTNIFSDNFNDNTIDPWSTGGSYTPTLSNSNPQSSDGGYYARLQGSWLGTDASIYTRINTGGFTSIQVSFLGRTSGGTLICEWRTFGTTTYNSISSVTSSSWASYGPFNLPSGAENSDIQLRFRINGSIGDTSYVDGVIVTGLS
jgi:hypothetical protein